jgi:hypothetical protein
MTSIPTQIWELRAEHAKLEHAQTPEQIQRRFELELRIAHLQRKMNEPITVQGAHSLPKILTRLHRSRLRGTYRFVMFAALSAVFTIALFIELWNNDVMSWISFALAVLMIAATCHMFDMMSADLAERRQQRTVRASRGGE